MLAAYPSYRASGTPWAQQIPEHWQTARLRYVAHIGNGTTPSRDRADYWQNGTIPWLNSGQVNDYVVKQARQFITPATQKAASLHLLPKGSVIVGMVGQGKTRGMSAYLDTDATINQNLAGITPFPRLHGHFLHYELIAAYNFLRNYGRGGNQAALNCGIIGSFSVLLPPLPEQDQIAHYLRTQDAKIARFIRIKRELIARLNEQKLRLIDHAVTGGLDTSTQRKPSSVAWLGEVPEHWEVLRLKRVCRFIYGEALGEESRCSGDVLVFGSNGKVGKHNAANACGPCIVIGRKGSFGKVNYSEHDVFVIDTAFYVDGHCTKANIRWLYYLLLWCRLDNLSKDSAVPGLHREDAHNAFVPFCDIQEQEQIAAYLDKKTTQIDAAIAQSEQEITLIREYRERLIQDAVTGQIDLRGWQPSADDAICDDELAALADPDTIRLDEEEDSA